MWSGWCHWIHARVLAVFLLCNPSHDSTVKNAGTQRYHFKHNFSQEPQILSVELNEDMLWWPTTESVAFKETCWWDCTVHPANRMSGTVFVPLRILLGVLIGGQICLTSTWVVIFCRFFGLPYLFFFLPFHLVLSPNGGELCMDGRVPADRYSRCADEGWW